MKAQGMMERLIPYLDDYQLTMLKIQNFKNRSVPSGWWINLDALENVALSKGGAAMQPKELLQMFFETGVLVGRSIGLDGNPLPANIQPVIPIENTAASELQMFFTDLVNTITAIEQMTGYNQITAGDPNPKTLVPGYETANISTNDALYPMAFAETYLSERLAEDVLLRMQQGIKKGGIEGYAPALNNNVLRFIQLSASIAMRDYGIMLEEKTTQEQKIWLMQLVQQDIANGYLDTSDAILIINTHNAKQAMEILAYRVKKAKQAAAEQKMRELEMANQGNLQNAQIAEQSKLAAKQMEGEIELQKTKMTIFGEIEKEKIRQQEETNRTRLKIMGQGAVAADNNDAKVEAATITADAKIEAQSMAVDGAIKKQEIANEKPVSTPKK